MKSAQLEEYPNYVIFENGWVLNKVTKNYLLGTTNKAGYFYYRLTNEKGVARTFGRHQLLALCFIKKPQSNEELIVNHKNGIKGDDRIDNLEWCTYKENAEHAGELGISPKCVPILARNALTGEILEFPSMIEAARYFDMHKDSMQYRLRNSPDIVYPEGFQYKRKHEESEWLKGIDKRVIVRNPFTGGERIMKNLAEVCREFNIAPASGTKWIRLLNTPVLPGYFQMKYVTDSNPWSEHSNPELSLALFNKTKPVFVYQGDKCIKIYSSCKECADALGIKTTTLNERFKKFTDHFFLENLCYKKSA